MHLVAALVLAPASAHVPHAGGTPLAWRAEVPRPDPRGEVVQVDVDDFRIHFSIDGVDAVEPSKIDVITAALQEGRDLFLDEGWRAPVGDDGEGGSEALDVYVRQLDVNGYAFPDQDGSCYLAIDPDVTAAGHVLRSVVIHELHHCVQFRYTTDLPVWLFEAAATYEQYAHVESPVLEVALAALYVAELDTPERPLESLEPPNDPYTTFLFTKFWTEVFSPEPASDRLPRLWEALAAEDRWRARLDAAARAELSLSLDALFLEYAVWNATACRADGLYDPDVLPCIADVEVPADPLEVGSELRIEHTDGPFTAHYLALEPQGPGTLVLRCDGEHVGVALHAHASPPTAEDPGSSRGRGVDPEARLTLGEPAPRVTGVVVGTRGALQTSCRAERLPPERGCATSSGREGLAWLVLPALLLRRTQRGRLREEAARDRRSDCGDRI